MLISLGQARSLPFNLDAHRESSLFDVVQTEVAPMQTWLLTLTKQTKKKVQLLIGVSKDNLTPTTLQGRFSPRNAVSTTGAQWTLSLYGVTSVKLIRPRRTGVADGKVCV